MTTTIPQQVQALYGSFDQAMIDNLPHVYHADIAFHDPMHRVEGLDNLTRYFQGMIAGLRECRFEFSQLVTSHWTSGQGALESSLAAAPALEQAVLFWTMHYRHKKLAGGKRLSLTGNSHIQFRDKVIYHRDYFDAGAMLYEHLPLMGFAIKQIKKRLEV